MNSSCELYKVIQRTPAAAASSNRNLQKLLNHYHTSYTLDNSHTKSSLQIPQSVAHALAAQTPLQNLQKRITTLKLKVANGSSYFLNPTSHVRTTVAVPCLVYLYRASKCKTFCFPLVVVRRDICINNSQVTTDC